MLSFAPGTSSERMTRDFELGVGVVRERALLRGRRCSRHAQNPRGQSSRRRVSARTAADRPICSHWRAPAAADRHSASLARTRRHRRLGDRRRARMRAARGALHTRGPRRGRRHGRCRLDRRHPALRHRARITAPDSPKHGSGALSPPGPARRSPCPPRWAASWSTTRAPGTSGARPTARPPSSTSPTAARSTPTSAASSASAPTASRSASSMTPDDHRAEALAGTHKALTELKAAGRIGAVGIGMNSTEAAADLLSRAEFDVALIAGRYTLLDQSALDRLYPLCASRGVSVIAAGVFNSGILADPSPERTSTMQRRTDNSWPEPRPSRRSVTDTTRRCARPRSSSPPPTPPSRRSSSARAPRQRSTTPSPCTPTRSPARCGTTSSEPGCWPRRHPFRHEHP